MNSNQEAGKMVEKLTKAQRSFLEALAVRPVITAREQYKPAAKLVERGLASKARIRWSPVCEYVITEAGRAALNSINQEGKGEP